MKNDGILYEKNVRVEKMDEEEQGRKFGFCECGHPLYPVHFIERNKNGKIRMAVSHLECSICGKKECVDDTFDQKKWYSDTKEVREWMSRISELHLREMH